VSSTGSGTDQPHLRALLRAFRLRIAAPGAADTGAALGAAGPSSGASPSPGTHKGPSARGPEVQGEALARYEPTTWTAVVVEHDLRRNDLAVVRLRPYLPMPFRPGQYARIEVPDLPGVWRPYSLAGAPRRDNIVELHVRAKTEAGVSGSLVYRTEVGDTVRIARAEGAMRLPEEPERDLLLIAGDTGVAPLKAMLTELAATDDRRSAVLFWGARTLDELYDIEEVTEIARAARRATVVPVISEGSAGPYASGLVTDAVAAYGEWSKHEVYLAGPPIMLAATRAALLHLGVDPECIHHDAPEG
jgi:NAD(P)H-flavin reductase